MSEKDDKQDSTIMHEEWKKLVLSNPEARNLYNIVLGDLEGKITFLKARLHEDE